jgi:glycosyltransferase involved in cell wall biosynthesis
MPDDPPLILCVGRLSPVKDHPTLLKAIALLRESQGTPFRVVVLGGPAGAGDERYVRSLHRQVQDLGLQQMVYFEPSVAMVNLPSWYQRSTVCVNLTPTGFGDKVALEAMSCARPCVVANEGFKETLGEYAGLLLFQNQNPQDLARRLRWLLCLPEEFRAELGVHLREHVMKKT